MIAHASNSLLLTLGAIGLVCATFCVVILAFLLKSGLAWKLATDIPNERSLHVRPTPRVGGWGVVPVLVVATLLMAPSLWLIALGAVFLAAVSQIDDRRGLPARVRFAAHFLAVLMVVAIYPAPIPWWCAAIIAFLMLWLVNLYNFMDGADGLAGGMAFFGFGGYAIAALAGPHPVIALSWASVAVAGAALGFLILNFHPAKIFLGDAGSIPLGFLAGALGYWGWRQGAWPVWFPALVFSPFIGDASVTLIRRLARGEKFWQAHREHYYQRMVRLGESHAAMAVKWYVVMFVGIIIALLALESSPALQWGIVAGWAIVLALLGAVVDARWRNFQFLTRQSEVDADASQ